MGPKYYQFTKINSYFSYVMGGDDLVNTVMPSLNHSVQEINARTHNKGHY